MSGAGGEALRDAVVWLDGRIVGIGEARIPVTDHGLLYGDGIFEGIRVYGGRIFRLDRHLGRFDLFAADEVFLTGTGAGLVPVRSLDAAPIGAGAPGPVFEKLRIAFSRATRAFGTPLD